MTRETAGPSPPQPSDGDEPRELYDELTDDLLYDPAIGRATMMGYPCVRLAGRFLASYDEKARCIVVKLPRERVAELVAEGSADPFAPAGKVFREWVSIATIDRGLWQQVLAEAVAFARLGLKPLTARPGGDPSPRHGGRPNDSSSPEQARRDSGLVTDSRKRDVRPPANGAK